MTTCPFCGHPYQDEESASAANPQVSCPRCKRSTAQEASQRLDEEDIPTAESSQADTGGLSEGKNYAVVVVSGNDPGKLFTLEKPRVTIGRIESDIELDDGKLSRQHALIAINGTTVRLQDLGSTNGTFVNDDRINQVVLDDRTEFLVGDHTLMFIMTDREMD